MSQHPRHFHYKFAHYMCDLCQHELRLQAAQVGARASPAQAGSQQRKAGPACARTTEVGDPTVAAALLLGMLFIAVEVVKSYCGHAGADCAAILEQHQDAPHRAQLWRPASGGANALCGSGGAENQPRQRAGQLDPAQPQGAGPGFTQC